MIGPLLGLAGLVALLAWLMRRGESPRSRIRQRSDDGDRAELEAAEREVRDLDAGARPDDGFLGDDWGPGSSRPRPPELL